MEKPPTPSGKKSPDYRKLTADDYEEIRVKLGLHRGIWNAVPNSIIEYVFQLENTKSSPADTRFGELDRITKLLPFKGTTFNPRLIEFFGDAILELLVRKRLLLMGYLYLTPIEATVIAQSAVANVNLRCIMQSKNLCQYVDPDKDKYCANILESILGMLYFWLVLEQRIKDPLNELDLWMDETWKFDTRLQTIIRSNLPDIRKQVKEIKDKERKDERGRKGPKIEDKRNTILNKIHTPPAPTCPTQVTIKNMDKWSEYRKNKTQIWKDFLDTMNPTTEEWNKIIDKGYYLGLFPGPDIQSLKNFINQYLHEFLEKVPIDRYHLILPREFPKILGKLSIQQEKELTADYKNVLKKILGDKTSKYVPEIFNMLNYVKLIDLHELYPSIQQIMNYILDYYDTVSSQNLLELWSEYQESNGPKWTKMSKPEVRDNWDIAIRLGFELGLLDVYNTDDLYQKVLPELLDLQTVTRISDLRAIAEYLFPDMKFNTVKDFKDAIDNMVNFGEAKYAGGVLKLYKPDIPSGDLASPKRLAQYYLNIYQKGPVLYHNVNRVPIKQPW